MTQSNPSTQNSPSNDSFISVALAIFGLLGPSAFEAAHHHIISTVGSVLLCSKDVDSKSQRPNICPLWYVAYAKVFETYLALKAARDALEAVLKEADSYAPTTRKRNEALWKGVTDRYITLLAYDTLAPSPCCKFRRLQFEDRKKEVE